MGCQGASNIIHKFDLGTGIAFISTQQTLQFKDRICYPIADICKTKVNTCTTVYY